MGYISDLRKYVGHQPILTAGVGLFVFNSSNKILMQLRTDYDSLLQSELYEKHYKVEVNEGILPKLVEEKYVLVPGRIFRGEMEDISVLQEHVVGREEYVLSLGSPSKKTSRRLANSFS